MMIYIATDIYIDKIYIATVYVQPMEKLSMATGHGNLQLSRTI